MTGSTIRCLWLSGDIPYPRLSGRRVYSAGLSNAIAAAGVEVVACGIDVDRAQTESTAVEWRPVTAMRPTSAARKLASRWPSMAEDRRTTTYRAALDAALREPGWDVAVVDHLQMCWALPALRAAGVPIVYASQNHESSTRRESSTNVSWRDPMKAPLVLDARRAHRAERALVVNSSLVTAVTEADAVRFRADGARDVVVLSPGYSGATRGNRTINGDTPRAAVMVTNLEWHVKQANLMRLLDVADPLLADAGIELQIVGPAPSEFVDRVTGGLRATRFVGRVESLADALDAARVGIVCEREGGGFKLKALDYVFGRVAMAVLEGSMEGLPLSAGVDYVCGDTEEALAHEIVALVDDPAMCQRMQTSAFEHCATRFDWSTRGSELAAALQRVVTTGKRNAR
ncbi:MAG TPA: glycosyltransferase [Ilumatobacteraceae bacterium]|nr:glycosyltransferase [Ilumatobacteraceae bacterium]